jgi:CDP-diglyceride synthetase
MLEHISAVLGVKSSGLIAGFLGSLVSLRFVDGAKTWTGLVLMALAGTLTAAYIAPAITEYLGSSQRVEHALTFGIGMFGMTIAGAIVCAVRELKLADAIASWLKRG